MPNSILLLEDDHLKAAKLRELVQEVLPGAAVTHEMSFSEGLRAVVSRSWDLIILDMTLPAFHPSSQKGNRMRPYAGKELLYQLRLRDVTSAVVVVTQFDVFGQGGEKRTIDQLRAELRAEFGDQYLGIVYFSPSEVSWREQLSKVLLNLGIKQ